MGPIASPLCQLILLSSLAAAPPAPSKADEADPVLRALVAEADEVSKSLKGQGDAPLYYLSYRVRDGNSVSLAASYGALVADASDDDPLSGRNRYLDVLARVGSPTLDNTHKVRTGRYEFDMGDSAGSGGFAALPVEDDEGAVRLAIWRATDRAYKRAVKQFIRVRANKAVKVAEDDAAADFSSEAAQTDLGPRQSLAFDRKAWEARLRKLSAEFKSHPNVLHSQVSLEGGVWTNYFVDTEGARVREPQSFLRLMISGSVKAADGMELELYRDFEALTPEQLPSEAELQAAVGSVITGLEALRTAPVIEPYSGPAIVTNRAAAVFFHEVFGHRIEGHRQKDADEGHTFTHKVGQPIVPSFISVVDDPTRVDFGGIKLNGHYRYDDEGVPARPTPLVEGGVLKGFLMSRSPIQGFDHSNGHGRGQVGLRTVSRQGNLLVSSSKQVPFAELRRKLVEEVKRQGKPYGLLFEDISGGYTLTRADSMPQAFKVLPLVVKRVYADGRPDELVRGVNLIGTPLAAFEKILATGDDFAVFNGYCGAESGYIPVSAVAPSLLIGELEVERQTPNHDRAPLLPPPLHPEVDLAAAPAPAAAKPEVKPASTPPPKAK